MPKRPASARPSLKAPHAAPPRPRDPVSRLGRYLQFMALGLIAVALFIPFTAALQLPNHTPLPWDYFPSALKNAAVLAVHTRLPWVVLAIISLLVTVAAYRTRRAPAIGRPALLCMAALPLVVAIHAAALGYLHSQSPLIIEIHGPAPAALATPDVVIAPATAGAPALEIHAMTVTRLTMREGTIDQWRLLLAGDAMFCTPILLVFLLRLAAAKVAKSNPALLK